MKTVWTWLQWPTRALRDFTYDHLGGRRFNDWANDKERQWRGRRNAPLVTSLERAGLHDAAERLDRSARQ